MESRICIITLVRAIKITNARASHITEDYLSIGLLSNLEPLLGIINCCLPVSRPVILRTMDSVGLSRMTVSKPSVRPAFATIGSNRTRKTTDPYTLDTIVTKNSDFITVVGKSVSSEEGDSVKRLVNDDCASTTILVKQGWNLEYE